MFEIQKLQVLHQLITYLCNYELYVARSYILLNADTSSPSQHSGPKDFFATHIAEQTTLTLNFLPRRLANSPISCPLRRTISLCFRMQRAKGQESTKVDKYLLCQNICAYSRKPGKAVENWVGSGGGKTLSRLTGASPVFFFFCCLVLIGPMRWCPLRTVMALNLVKVWPPPKPHFWPALAPL